MRIVFDRLSRIATLGGHVDEKAEDFSYLVVGRRVLHIRSSRPARKWNNRVEGVVSASLPHSFRLHHPCPSKSGCELSRSRWSSHRFSDYDCDQDRIRNFRGQSLSQIVSFHDWRRSFLSRGSVSAEKKPIQEVDFPSVPRSHSHICSRTWPSATNQQMDRCHVNAKCGTHSLLHR